MLALPRDPIKSENAPGCSYQHVDGSPTAHVAPFHVEDPMNENEQTRNQSEGFFSSLLKDDGVQRSFAGVAVAIVVAGLKRALFSGVS
jgi:hypothetical protein